MNSKHLINQLGLSYSPISNYDFQFLMNDIGIQRAIEDSKIYVIGQRPVLSFENIEIDADRNQLVLQIRQELNLHLLKCVIPLNQKLFSNQDDGLYFQFGSNDELELKQLPASNIHGIKIYKNEPLEENFIIWITPEKLLVLYYKNLMKCTIEGDITSFLRYKTHYVGKSIKQKIWKRIEVHRNLQKILSIEYPEFDGSIPTHEIVLLFFRIQDSMQLTTLGDTEEDIEEMVQLLMTGKSLVDKDDIYSDGEKALIQVMLPKYNKRIYKSYPTENDIFISEGLKSLFYSIIDPITLIYEDGEISGSSSWMNGDLIKVENEGAEILRKKILLKF